MFKINTFFFIVFLITFFHCKQPNQLAQDELTVIKELSALEAIVEPESRIRKTIPIINHFEIDT